MKSFTKGPQIAIILVLLGVIGAAGAILFFRHGGEPKVEAQVEPRAARLERVDGNVDIAQALNQQDNDQLDWQDATANAPLTVGERVFARDNSHAEIAFTGRNSARLNPNAALDVLSLADQRTQLALRSGSAIFDVGDLAKGELFEVATPCGAVDFSQPGLYQIGFGDDGNPLVSVLNGMAQVVGPTGTAELNKGQAMTLSCEQSAQNAPAPAPDADQTAVPAPAPAAAPVAVVSRLAPETAGAVVDDYYRYRYPKTYDGRYTNYDTYLSSPDYYDPYAQSASYRDLDESIPGLYDLDQYGDWQDVDGYGRCWAPRVEADWSPYREGLWENDNTWGPTWVASEPWGYAPYHYGRWAYVNQTRWVWVPEGCRRDAVYAPALVAFVPVQQSEVAWVPLGPGEAYVSRYYDNYEPRYYSSTRVIERQNYINLNYINAVTVVPVNAFNRRIDRSVIVAANPQWFRGARPVADPYAIAGLRQAAIQQAREQRRAARGLQVAAFNRPVVTSVAPILPPGRGNAARAMQYQAVTEKQKGNKLQVQNNGQVITAQRPNGMPAAGQQQAPNGQQQAFNAQQQAQQQQRIADLKARVRKGDNSAQQELQQAKQERRQQQVAQQQQQAQQTPEQRHARKQEQKQQAQQQGQPQQQQAQQAQQDRQQQKQQMKAQRQQQAQQAQQQAAQQQQQRQQQKQQMKAQRQQQQQSAASQQQQQAQQQRQQQKQQMKAQRQQQAGQQQQQVRQQQQQQRQQQAAQQQAARQQQKQQMKAQRQVQQQQPRPQQQAQPRPQPNPGGGGGGKHKPGKP